MSNSNEFRKDQSDERLKKLKELEKEEHKLVKEIDDADHELQRIFQNFRVDRLTRGDVVDAATRLGLSNEHLDDAKKKSRLDTGKSQPTGSSQNAEKPQQKSEPQKPSNGKNTPKKGAGATQTSSNITQESKQKPSAAPKK
ncbi:unnamed protein product [Nippostrongylus brasiliensis]|uniref:Scaffolding protein n=1 Tax=Nippostrongylus brasiliensis TaxID=27835 RepID=A0A0N4Y1J4_NIPBR|nr:unnamed protein product [Nippostrongylus brasiliensis]